MADHSEQRKRQQWIVIGVIAFALVAIIVVLGQVMQSRQPQLVGAESDRLDETIIADRTSQASPELTWARDSQKELDRLALLVGELTAAMTTQKDERAAEIAAIRKEYDEQLIEQQARLDALSGTGSVRPAEPGMALGAAGENYGQEFVGGGAGRVQIPAPGWAGPGAPSGSGAPAGPGMPVHTGFSVDFTLKARPEPAAAGAAEEEQRIFDSSSYIPSGSYAPAVVLSGVDAPAGVSSQEDPIPVLLRVTGAATGPNGRRFNLNGCTVIGAATAALSSERVNVRLTKMTCGGRNGKILETPIAGLISGDGKAGVRGLVVERTGNLTGKAAAAGFLGGFASAVENAASISTANEEAKSIGAVLAGAGAGMIGGGASNAANTLAEYYIKKAEQYVPVVSLYSGTQVEMVFMEGVKL
ncbi:TrbI/VirB10 family protein [Methylobacterium sp.]|uniref:TrbI/VirB10 family protein n=1 Tax=Methylobacterium sp. TaxID=409 RepID=UPI003C7311A0